MFAYWLSGLEAKGEGVDVHPVARAFGTGQVPRVGEGNSVWSIWTQISHVTKEPRNPGLALFAGTQALRAE